MKKTLINKFLLPFVFCLIFAFTFESYAQQNTTGYGFENNNWQTKDSTYLKLSKERAIEGNTSLKFSSTQSKAPLGLYSINTGLTISKVRVAKNKTNTYIIASSYEGIVLGVDYYGTVKWKNKLSGVMNHDIWCDDLDGDGIDEILVANADGNIYCLGSDGKLKWKFSKNTAPMYAVCVVKKNNVPYVVCGGYDTNIYYLSASGSLVSTLASSGYSKEKTFGDGILPPNNLHVGNFLRTVKLADGSDILAIHATNNSMQNNGNIYLFKILETTPYKIIKPTTVDGIGDLKVFDTDGDGVKDLVFGTSGGTQASVSNLLIYNVVKDTQKQYVLDSVNNKLDGFGYRVVQTEAINDGGIDKYFILFGSRVILVPKDFSINKTEVLACKYAFNDMWKDTQSNKILLASSQSGGSCIHVIDPSNPAWKSGYSNLSPPGKIDDILKNTASARNNLKNFIKPSWERSPMPVYLMSENITSSVSGLVNTIKSTYQSPIFLNSYSSNKVENWDRSAMTNVVYRDKRDGRKSYTLTSQEVVNSFTTQYINEPGISFWGGHGNDPYMYSLATLKKVIDIAKNKKTAIIYPELEAYDSDFAFVMNDLFYPLATYSQGKDANLYIRTKHAFWQSIVYLPLWSRLVSGEFADVFVPSMEETTDKAMDISIASRVGLWASGATNSWGARCARDNASFDRMRQHSHQMLPNHFLRAMVYDIANGAQYIDNFTVDQNYMSFLWELIAKGALYVPKKQEVISYSPVHLSMLAPDSDFLNEASNVKWITFYNADYESKNPFVFSRQNGSWPGAPVTAWDFSRYAANVKDRHLNFIPSYSNGLVLITPPQKGVNALSNQPRGKLEDHLNPIYKNILKEYYTDGRYYYSADGSQKFNAQTYYSTIENDIKESAKLLPVTVKGDNVAWVAAQTSPTHIRITLIDGGYINPDNRIATLSFHTVKPVKVIDLLDGKSFGITDPLNVVVDIPCGLFRFIDIELNSPL